MTAARAIILLGSERSGTNLLRSMLAAHPCIASPQPCGMVNALAGQQFRRACDAERPVRLVDDVIALTTSHLSPWEYDIDRDAVIARLHEYSFWAVFRAVNELYAERARRSHWLSKEPGMFRHAYEIRAHIPAVKFIYLVRDGRDVAASMLESGVHEYHVYAAARRWAAEQRLCLTVAGDPLLAGTSVRVRYERLVAQPAAELTRVMEFVGLQYDPVQLQFFRRQETARHAASSVLWRNLTEPVSRDRAGSYRRRLSRRQISIFESVAWNELRCAGYAPDCATRRHLSAPQKTWYAIATRVRRRLRAFRHDPESYRRRERDALVRAIRAREVTRS